MIRRKCFLAISTVLLLVGVTAPAAFSQAQPVRWDIVSLTGGAPPGPINLGGPASATPPGGVTTTLTGGGTFVAPSSGGGASAVAGGGTAAAASGGSGTHLGTDVATRGLPT